jgi:hypothetical protein
MKLKNILISLCLLALSSTASAGLITFDDIASQNSNRYVDQHAGYNFSRPLLAIDLVGPIWNYGAVSGDFGVLGNGSCNFCSITAIDSSDFYFGGLWAKKWGTAIDSGGSDSLFGSMRGMNDGQVVWQVSTGLNGSYKHFSAQNIAIDSLQLNFGNYFIFDDLTLSSTPTDVPEPSSLAILGLGLLGLVRFRKKA